MKKIISFIVLVCVLAGVLCACGTRIVCDDSCTEKPEAEEKQEVTYLSNFDKPVIYLYGYDNKEVEVKLNFKGDLTCVYPKMTSNKWVVNAQKGGTLKVKDRKYSYLYWEGRSDTKFDFSTGYCVEGEKTAVFLEETLALLGLNEKEANEFIVYWLPKMQDNKYNVISFQGKTYTDTAKLTVSPAPSKMIRVFMAYYPSDEKVNIKTPAIKEKVTRNNGETLLVEWGGAQVNDETFVQDVISEESEEDENVDLAEKLAAMSNEELQKILTQAVEIRKENGDSLITVQEIKGKEFTDKNGEKYTFSEEEWKYLQDSWAYTGQPNSVIAQFTVNELKTYLKNNMKK